MSLPYVLWHLGWPLGTLTLLLVALLTYWTMAVLVRVSAATSCFSSYSGSAAALGQGGVMVAMVQLSVLGFCLGFAVVYLVMIGACEWMDAWGMKCPWLIGSGALCIDCNNLLGKVLTFHNLQTIFAHPTTLESYLLSLQDIWEACFRHGALLTLHPLFIVHMVMPITASAISSCFQVTSSQATLGSVMDSCVRSLALWLMVPGPVAPP